jgi:hypothetical protein
LSNNCSNILVGSGDEDSDEDIFGDFEDLETGEKTMKEDVGEEDDEEFKPGKLL